MNFTKNGINYFGYNKYFQKYTLVLICDKTKQAVKVFRL